VASQANDAAALVSPLKLRPSLGDHSLPPPTGALGKISLGPSATVVAPGIHGPPLFLKVRSLRL